MNVSGSEIQQAYIVENASTGGAVLLITPTTDRRFYSSSMGTDSTVNAGTVSFPVPQFERHLIRDATAKAGITNEDWG